MGAARQVGVLGTPLMRESEDVAEGEVPSSDLDASCAGLKNLVTGGHICFSRIPVYNQGLATFLAIVTEQYMHASWADIGPNGLR